MCVCAYSGTYVNLRHNVHVEVSGQTGKFSSFLLPCGFQGSPKLKLNSDP